MPSLRDRQQTLLQTTFQAAALALLAGTMASVTLAQDGKETKDPKTGLPVAPAQPVVHPPARDPKVTRPTTQPTAGDGKTPAANVKSGQPAAPKAAPTQPAKANPTTPTPAATPAAAPPAADGAPAARTHNFPPPPDGWFRFDAFAEPVDVTLLVDLVADRLKVQIISTDTALRDKKIQLYTPVDVPEEKLLDFLGLLLEQNGQFIRKDALGFYVIEPQTSAGGNINAGSDLSTTQVVPTRGLKPTSLTLAIAQVLKGGPSATGQPGVPQGPQAGPNNIAYLDDLGVLVMTDTPRRIAAVKNLIEELSNEQINLEFTRFEVRNLSASIAKQRMLELLGQSQRIGTNAFNPNNQNDPNQGLNTPVTALGGGVSSSNIATRLIPDPQSNALSLRGRPEEIELIARLLAVVDVPNQLVPKWYAVGPASQALADQGKRAGLGDVTIMQSTRGSNNQQNNNNQGGFFQEDGGFNGFNRNNQSNQTTSGPVFVLDADQRGFMYYGTPEQHVQLEKLVKEFGEITQAERVVYEFYKLKFVDAEKTSDLIRGMINNTVPGGESPLIPGAGGGTAGRNRSLGASQAVTARQATGGTGGADDAIVATEDVFVLPDKSNNQVVVKAPQRLQPQFARLISKIDLRRPQVYIDAKIIVVTNREDFKLAVETQLVNAGGAGGVLRTLFPGGTASGGNILTPPTVGAPSASVGGIAAAVILSDYVPIIINAVATSGSGRVVASPQLLVDDNEEAVISSIAQQPTTTTQAVAGSEPITSFGGYQDAGPKLTIKPRLSTGDLLSLKYEVELSSFRGDSVGGVPPAKDVANIKSDSVTLPSDSTIVVGGLEFSQKDNTVVKVPFLGDIPIVGELFKSTSNNEQRRTIYVFITPRIMRDPIGNDLRFISEGPARRAGNENSLPPVRLELIEINGGSVRKVEPAIAPEDVPADSGLGSSNPVSPNVEPGAPVQPTPLQPKP